MRSNPFNSLDQALAKAKRAKAESAERKTAIFLIVGLDFGTAYTKCMVRRFQLPSCDSARIRDRWR